MPRYLQMDMESARDQMATLLSWAPGRVYKTAYYRKQTKNQWARDDPAFAVLQIAVSTAGAVAYGLAFGVRGIWGYIALIAHAVLLHWLLFGVVAATVGRGVANGHLLAHRAHSVEQRVEWLYAFDIHCNAYFMVSTRLSQHFAARRTSPNHASVSAESSDMHSCRA
jgi:hypothetical protein